MKIEFKKKHLNISLTFGVIWLVFSLFVILIKEKAHWFDYGYLIIAVSYLALYFHQKQNKYISINDEVIKVNGLFGKKINTKDVKQMKRFAGDIILKTDKTELTINTQVIDPDSLNKLEVELEKLNRLITKDDSNDNYERVQTH